MNTYDHVDIALLFIDHTPEQVRELCFGISDEDFQAGLELWRVLDWWGIGWLKQNQYPHKKGN
jgi:hypothetical protein